MKFLNTTESVNIPDGVTVTVKSRVVTVKGPRGQIQKNFRHAPVDIQMGEQDKKRNISVSMWFGRYKQKSMTKTVSSLINNMIKGVTKGYRYKMRLVASHFPIKVEIPKDQKSIIIRNFLGGKKDKTVICKQGVTIKVDEDVKDMLVLDGIDNANVSLTAALIS